MFAVGSFLGGGKITSGSRYFCILLLETTTLLIFDFSGDCSTVNVFFRLDFERCTVLVDEEEEGRFCFKEDFPLIIFLIGGLFVSSSESDNRRRSLVTSLRGTLLLREDPEVIGVLRMSSSSCSFRLLLALSWSSRTFSGFRRFQIIFDEEDGFVLRREWIELFSLPFKLNSLLFTELRSSCPECELESPLSKLLCLPLLPGLPCNLLIVFLKSVISLISPLESAF